jgi:hypothetical protein
VFNVPDSDTSILKSTYPVPVGNGTHSGLNSIVVEPVLSGTQLPKLGENWFHSKYSSDVISPVVAPDNVIIAFILLSAPLFERFTLKLPNIHVLISKFDTETLTHFVISTFQLSVANKLSDISFRLIV